MKNVNNTTIGDIKDKYYQALSVTEYSDISPRGRDGVFIGLLDLDLIISHVIKKEREFVLAHPEYTLISNQQSVISKMIARRLKNEPLAYILGEKEFYGLNFKVTPHTLIPRPETELMVELALQNVISHQSSVISIIDIGTGSGNIIISLAHQLKNTSYKLQATSYFATDISEETLKTAKQNAKLHNVHKKINFLHGNLLSPFLKHLSTPKTGIHNTKYTIQNTNLLVLANLPYLSRDIYNACTDNVKKYEPKTALYSANHGLSHYDKLLKQIKLLVTSYEPCPEAKLFGVTALLEISPEQKKLLPPLVKKYFPKAKIEFKKDLAQKWRVCKVEIE